MKNVIKCIAWIIVIAFWSGLLYTAWLHGFNELLMMSGLIAGGIALGWAHHKVLEE